MDDKTLSTVFAALADPARRAILLRLAGGTASVNALTEVTGLSQPGTSKHIKVLERAGLIARGQVAQSRPCYVRTQTLDAALLWMTELHRRLAARYDRLEDVLEEMKTDPAQAKGRSQLPYAR